MANTKAQGSVPRLRFPSVPGGSIWKRKRLGQFCKVNPSADALPAEFFYIDLGSVDAGVLKSKQQTRKLNAPSRAQRVLQNGDVLFQAVRPYQRNNFFFDLDDGVYVASTGYAQLRSEQSPRFLYQLVHTDPFIEKVLSKCTGSNYPAINSSDLEDIEIDHPKEDEQQKIADCLSSIDADIAAESRKLDALKAYKQGLMQQLFPVEGQRLPRLRFPEFRGVAGWHPQPLDTFIDEFRQKSTKQDEYEVLTSAKGGLVKQRDYYDNDRITGRDNIGFNVIPPGYLTYRSRSDDRHFYFNENELGITGIISTYYPVFCVRGGSNKFFIELLTYYSGIVGRHSVGTSQTVLSLNSLRSITLSIPEADEQQKIARCLSSLNNVIVAQSSKLTALQQHKKGLMQGLFPAVDAYPA